MQLKIRMKFKFNVVSMVIIFISEIKQAHARGRGNQANVRQDP